jgi:hypothetical protein
VAERGFKVVAMTAIDSGIDALTPVTGLAVTLTDGVLSVTIDRPESLNSLTTPILRVRCGWRYWPSGCRPPKHWHAA